MPKNYYRCSYCHNKVKSPEYYCRECGKMGTYKCQHNYWWELFYITIRDLIRKLKGIK